MLNSLCLSFPLLSLLSIFMIITLNALSDRLHISTWLNSSEILSCSFIWNIFLCCLILPNFLFLFVCLGGLIMFPDLGEVSLHRNILLDLAAPSPLVNRAISSRGAPCVVWVGSSVVVSPTTMGAQVGGASFWLVGLLDLLCRGCSSLVAKAGSWHGWLHSLGISGTGSSPLVGGAGSWQADFRPGRSWGSWLQSLGFWSWCRPAGWQCQVPGWLAVCLRVPWQLTMGLRGSQD